MLGHVSTVGANGNGRSRQILVPGKVEPVRAVKFAKPSSSAVASHTYMLPVVRFAGNATDQANPFGAKPSKVVDLLGLETDAAGNPSSGLQFPPELL